MNINGAQIHLLINHFPVVGYPIVFIALVWGLFNKQFQIFFFGIYLSIFIWLSTLISYLTGEGAEDTLRDLPDFSIDLVHTHEDTAFIALIIGGVIAVCAAALIPFVQNKISFLKSTTTERILRGLVVVGVLAVSLLLAVAAHQGGLIRHTEIR